MNIIKVDLGKMSHSANWYLHIVVSAAKRAKKSLLDGVGNPEAAPSGLLY